MWALCLIFCYFLHFPEWIRSPWIWANVFFKTICSPIVFSSSCCCCCRCFFLSLTSILLCIVVVVVLLVLLFGWWLNLIWEFSFSTKAWPISGANSNSNEWSQQNFYFFSLLFFFISPKSSIINQKEEVRKKETKHNKINKNEMEREKESEEKEAPAAAEVVVVKKLKNSWMFIFALCIEMYCAHANVLKLSARV